MTLDESLVLFHAVWSVFVLGGTKDSLRQSAVHIVWAYASTAAFVSYLATDPRFQVH